MRFSVRPFFTLLSRTISHKLYLYPVYTLVAECGHFHFDLLCNGTLEQRVCWVKDLISSQILNSSEISQEALAPPPRLPSHPPPPRRFSSFVFSPYVFPSSQLGLKPAEFKGGNGGRRINWRDRKEEDGGGWLAGLCQHPGSFLHFFKNVFDDRILPIWISRSTLALMAYFLSYLFVWRCGTPSNVWPFYFNLLSFFVHKKQFIINWVFTKASAR